MTALDIETFAHALAHVGHYPPALRDEVLARLGCTARDFDDAATTHPRALAKALTEGDEHPANLFGDTFKTTKKRLEAEDPSLERIRPFRAVQQAPAMNPAEDPTLEPTSAEMRRPPLPFRSDIVVRPPAYLQSQLAPGSTRGPGGTLDPAPARNAEERAFDAWTVERYATFTADRRVGAFEEVRAAYGIADDEHERALVAYMNRRLTATPAARERWMALVAARLAEIGARGRA